MNNYHLTDSPQAETSQSSHYLQYLEYVDIARIRKEKYGMLMKEGFELAQQYTQERREFDSNLLKNNRDQLILFQGLLPNFDHLSAGEQELAEAKLLCRKKILAYLIDHRQAIETAFRQQFILGRREKVTYGEITSAIAEEVVYNILYDLPPEARNLLFRELPGGEFADSHRRPGEGIFRLCQVYPPLENVTVNLYQKEDLEAFFGHLVGTISGLGKNLWEQFHNRSKALEMQLTSFRPRVNALPLAEYFGKLAEPMRIFFIQENMREVIEGAAGSGAAMKPGIPPEASLQLFSDFGRLHDSLDMLRQFSNLPASSATFDKVKAIVGKPTRRTLLKDLRKTLPGDLPLGDLYQVMCNIVQINALRNPTARGAVDELAVIFLMELETAMQFFNQRTANFTLITDLHAFRNQLNKIKASTEYALQQLQSATK